MPLCFGMEAPWRLLGVTNEEFAERVELNADVCLVDEEHFFVRGHITIPIHDHTEPFIWSVWCSLSAESFRHMGQRWESFDRIHDPPYFGWLMSKIPVYAETLHLKTSVQSQEVGMVPEITVEPSDHPLAIDQHHGITLLKVEEYVHHLLHTHKD